MRAGAKAVLITVVTGMAAGCGSSSSSPAPASSSGFFITISNMTYSPANLQAPPGAIITVISYDATTHSVTSEASAGNFTPGSVAGIAFDTGAFTGTRSFTIPANAPNGTVIPFYCTVHLTTMIPQNGTITVNSSAQPTAPPGGGGGGGGGY